MRIVISIAGMLAAALLASGCARNEAASAPPAAPQVSVAEVLEREVTEFRELTGRFQAVERVEVRPRVSGYVASVNFEEGRLVNEGDVLFVIDPRPYEAELKRARAELARARTQLSLAQAERDRALKLLDSRAISREEFDSRVANTDQASANVQAAEAALDVAELNLTFTRVRAPISGVVSRAEVTAGNLVTSGQTLLTTLVSIDPIYVEFEGDEHIYLEHTVRTRNGAPAEASLVEVGLANESGYPHQGSVVFMDNQIDPQTGTVRVRALLENDDRRFTPGMFARVKLLGSHAYSAVLINDSAVGTDQSRKYVLVVGPGNELQYRAVQLGPIVDGLRVIREGLAPGDVIVVNGLQRVRPGAVIAPQRVAMGQRPAHADTLAHNLSPPQ